jgi:hypothetical protein
MAPRYIPAARPLLGGMATLSTQPCPVARSFHTVHEGSRGESMDVVHQMKDTTPTSARCNTRSRTGSPNAHRETHLIVEVRQNSTSGFPVSQFGRPVLGRASFSGCPRLDTAASIGLAGNCIQHTSLPLHRTPPCVARELCIGRAPDRLRGRPDTAQ